MLQFVIVGALVASASCASIEIPNAAAFPFDDISKHGIQTAPFLVMDGVTTPIKYNTILASGQKANASELFAFGQLVNVTGQPVFEVDQYGNPDVDFVPNTTQVIGNYSISQNPDFTSILKVGDRLFSFVHFETPGPYQAYFVELQQNTSTCQLTAVSQQPTNWSQWGGLWTPCAGSVSPWQTHLGSEEYEPSALPFSLAQNLTEFWTYYDSKSAIQSQMRYWGSYPNSTTLADIKRLFKPYKYGHPTEMTAYANGTYSVKKHYSMGRIAWELPLVMPDNITVYGSDDGDNTMMLMFKAAKAGDLSCGTVYGGKFNQTSAQNGGNFTIQWIDMGYACDDQLIPLADNTTFADIFDYTKFDNTSATPCPSGFKAVNIGQYGVGPECLRLKPGQEIVASRFETRRYLAYLGGTTEWSKMEGITFSPNSGENGRIYIAISRVEGGMEDNAYKGKNSTMYDQGGANHIRVPWNRCGCVFQLEIDSGYNATQMSALICGNTKNNTDALNVCDRESISAPDNLSMMRGHNALIIGEDTADHQNDVVWIYTFDDAKLNRFQTTPFGSETTSVYWYENINGCAYMVSVVQHPYGESDENRAMDYASSGKAGRIGYLGPIRASAVAPQIRGPLATSTAGRRYSFVISILYLPFCRSS